MLIDRISLYPETFNDDERPSHAPPERKPRTPPRSLNFSCTPPQIKDHEGAVPPEDKGGQSKVAPAE